MLLSRAAARERETAILSGARGIAKPVGPPCLDREPGAGFSGGALGTLSSIWILQGILAIIPRFTLPAESDPQINLPVLLFTLAATIAAGLLCGAVQAWRASRADWSEAREQAGRGATGTGHRRLRDALVVAEFAMAVTLLSGAGLTILSFWKRTQTDLGVRTDHILTFSLPVNERRFSSTAQIDGFYRQLLERFQVLPGVVRVSVSAPDVPLRGNGFSRQFTLGGGSHDASSTRPGVNVQMVTPEYFETFGIVWCKVARLQRPMARVRSVWPWSTNASSNAFSKGATRWRERVAIGQFIPATASVSFGPGAPGSAIEWHIVGVFRYIGDLEHFRDPTAPQMYVPFAQSPWPQAVIMAVRTAGAPEALREASPWSFVRLNRTCR